MPRSSDSESTSTSQVNPSSPSCAARIAASEATQAATDARRNQPGLALGARAADGGGHVGLEHLAVRALDPDGQPVDETRAVASESV